MTTEKDGTDGLVLRPARTDEALALTELTRRSKAHWGYPPELLERIAELLTVSPATIRDGHVVVAERNERLLGYYQLAGDPPDGELADMFLDPAVIGTGLGRTLWDDAVRHARAAGHRTLSWESDPHAEAFYRHMGAERVGTREVAPGRVLPLMRASLDGAVSGSASGAASDSASNSPSAPPGQRRA